VPKKQKDALGEMIPSWPIELQSAQSMFYIQQGVAVCMMVTEQGD
jgi:hypothetical protein